MARIVIETTDETKESIRALAKSEANQTITGLMLEAVKFYALYRHTLPDLIKAQASTVKAHE